MNRIDAHCHFWRLDRGDYGWLAGQGGPLAPLRRDFLPADDVFARLLHFGHGRRNNEPFMEPLARMDLAAAHREAGFEAMRVVAFGSNAIAGPGPGLSCSVCCPRSFANL